MKKQLILSAVVAVSVLASASAYAMYPMGGGMGMGPDMQGPRGMQDWGHINPGQNAEHPMMNTGARQALLSGNYTGFVEIRNANHNKTAPSAEDFANRVSMQKAHEAVKVAISSGNYTGFVSAMQTLHDLHISSHSGANNSGKAMPEFKIPSATEFADMFKKYQAKEDMQNAVKNNDYNAFVTAWTANKPSAPTMEEFARLQEQAKKVKDLRGEIKEAKKDLKEIKKDIKPVNKAPLKKAPVKAKKPVVRR